MTLMKMSSEDSREVHNCFHICVDSERKYLSVNRLFAHTFCLEDSNYRDLSFDTHLVPEDLPALHTVIAKCASQPGEVFVTKLRLPVRASSVLNLQWEFVACEAFAEIIITAKGTVVNGPTTGTEAATTNAFLQASSPLLENILKYSLDIICAIDEEGKFLAISHACKDIWGYHANELLGRNYIDYVYQQDVDITLEVGEQISKYLI